MELVEVKYLGSDGQYQTYSPSDLALINKAAITTNFGGAEDYINISLKTKQGMYSIAIILITNIK